jgi:dCTP diphosphatase
MATEPDLTPLLELLRTFVRERDWEQFHDPKNLAMAVASEAGELAAELRWVKNDASDAWCREPENRQRLADEVADVLITTLMLADRAGLDPAQVIRDKMEKNGIKYPVARARGRAQ